MGSTLRSALVQLLPRGDDRYSTRCACTLPAAVSLRAAALTRRLEVGCKLAELRVRISACVERRFASSDARVKTGRETQLSASDLLVRTASVSWPKTVAEPVRARLSFCKLRTWRRP